MTGVNVDTNGCSFRYTESIGKGEVGKRGSAYRDYEMSRERCITRAILILRNPYEWTGNVSFGIRGNSCQVCTFWKGRLSSSPLLSRRLRFPPEVLGHSPGSDIADKERQ
jgi:hypothetical protein